jgi:hypothetical protein
VQGVLEAGDQAPFAQPVNTLRSLAGIGTDSEVYRGQIEKHNLADTGSGTYEAGRFFGPFLIPAGGVEAGAAKAGEIGASKVADRLLSRLFSKTCRLNSFTGDTRVQMADGSSKAIKDVALGDMVMATDPVTGVTAAKKVIDLIRHSGAHTMVAVQLSNGKTIHATDQHPFWVENRREWVYAIDLRTGDILHSVTGDTMAVTGLTISTDNLTAYNLTIEGLHTFYVLAGNTPVLVHNASEACSPHLALGLESIRGREVGTLDRFAQEQGAVTYKNGPFSDLIPRGVATPEALSKMMDRVVAEGGRISFNMKGIQDVEGILGGKDYGNGFTSHELRYVCGNAAVRAATTFFNGDAPC